MLWFVLLLSQVSFVTTSHAWVENENGVRENTWIWFEDRCTHKPTALLGPEGVSLNFEIQDLDPTQPLWIELRLAPAIRHPDSARTHEWTRNLFVPAKKIQYGKIKKSIDLRGFFTEIKDLTLLPELWRWGVSISWIQAERSGQAHNGIQVMRHPKGERFYQQQGVVACNWETAPRISSDYYYNPDYEKMNLSLKTALGTSSTQTAGVQVGIVPTPLGGVTGKTGVQPLLNPSSISGNSAWFYAQYQRFEETLHTQEITRSWTLARTEGGFYGEHLSFSRIPVQEWVPARENGCLLWRPGQKGWLDYGESHTEFYIVPLALAGNPEETSEFMSKMRAPVNTCNPSQFPMNAHARYQVPGAREGLLFFYPEGEIQP